MKALKDLVSVIQKHKIKNIEVIGNESVGFSKFSMLYEAIHSGEVNNDQEAAKYIYGTNSKDPRYRKLKSRLKSRLLNTLFFIDVNQNDFTDMQKAFYNCNKNWVAVRNLIERGARFAGIELAISTYKTASKYEITEIALLLAKELRFNYSVVKNDRSKFNFYNEEIKYLIDVLKAEIKAEEYLSTILKEYSISKESKKVDVVKKASLFLKDLKEKYDSIKSFRFIRIYFLLQSIRYELEGSYLKSIDICHNAISVLKSKPYKSTNAIFSFHLRILTSSIKIGNFEDGDIIAKYYIEYLEDGTYNWYVVLYYYFLLATHSEKYKLAFKLMHKAISHARFKSFYEAHKQMWHVNRAFCYFLYYRGEVDLKENDIKDFKLYKFLNEIPIYSKDKRGLNVSIIILQVLFLLHNKKYDKIVDRVDALNQYCHRYLKRDNTFRSNCFIKMLIKMAGRGNFNREATTRHTQNIFNKMREVPLNLSDQGVEVEIVPYEKLWMFVLDMLD